MKQFYTRRNIIFSLAISFAIVIFFVWYAYQNMQKVRVDTRAVNTTLESLRLLEKTLDNLQDAETSQQAYIISGDTTLLDAYRQFVNEVRADTSALRKLPLLAAHRTRSLNELNNRIGIEMQFLEEGVQAAQQPGSQRTDFELPHHADQENMQKIRELMLELEEEDREILNASNTDRENAARQTARLFAILAIAFAGVLVLFFLQLTRALKLRNINENRISFLADMVEQSGDAIISTSTDFSVLTWNKGAEEMYGYTREEAVGREYHQLLQSKRTEAERAKVVEKLMETGYYTEDLEYVKKNGQFIYIQASYTLLRDKTHQISGCSIVHRNITEKKLAEQLLTEFNKKLNKQVQSKTAELKIALERFDVVAKATNDVVWDADLLQGKVWWNDNFLEKFGYTPDDKTTNTHFWDDHIHPEDKERVLTHIHYILTSTQVNTWSDEYRFQKADGSYIHIYDRSSVLRDENGIAFRMIGSMADVTDLFHAREELVQSEEKYRTFVEQATDAIFVADTSGRFIVVNSAGIAMSGYTEAELTGLTIVDLADPDDLKRHPFHFDELKEGKAVLTERWIRRKNGERLQVEVNARLLSDGRLLAFIRDITEKKKAEEEVVRSNARFQMLSKATSDTIWDWNLDDDSLWWNDNYYTITGLPKTKEIAHINDWFSQIHADDRDRVKKSMTDAIAGPELVWKNEYRYTRNDGTFLYFFDRGHILRDKDGKAYRVIGSMVNITEIYLAKQKLEESEERYRSLIEQASDGILIYSLDGAIHNFNNSATLLTGYSHEEFRHLKLTDMLVGNIVSDPVKHEQIQAGEIVTLQRQVKRKDGSLIDIEVTVKLLRDGTYLGFARDITEKKKAQDELINNELKFRTLTVNAPVGIFQTDPEGKTTYVNESWLRFTGMQFDEALGDGWLAAVHPDDKEGLRQNWYEKSARGLPSASEYRLIDKNGRIKWVQGNAVPLYNSNGEVAGHIGTIADMTERKLALEALQESERKLHNVLSVTAESFYVIDRNFNITLINRSAQENLQKAWNHWVVPGTHLLDVIPDDDEPIRESLSKVFNGQQVEYELALQIEGLPPWVEVNYMPVRDDSGQVVGAYVAAKDISEKKLTNEKVRESEERYRALVENAPEALVVFDVDAQRFESVSESAVRLFKMPREKLLQVGPLAVSPEFQPDGRRSVEAAGEKISEAIQGGKPSFEWTHCDANGQLIPCEVWLVRLPSDDRILIRGSVVDISARKETEQMIRSIEETRRLIMNSSLDAIVCMDVSSKITFWTPQAERIFGWKEDEVLGRSVSEVIIPQHYRAQHEAGLARYKQTKTGPVLNRLIEITALGRDGIEFPVELSILPIQQGDTEFFCAFIRDITDRKKAEQAILLSEEKYRTLVEQAVDAIALYDADGRILDVNAGAVALLGYSSEELRSMILSEILTEEELSVNPVRYDVLQTGLSTVKQRVMRRKNGTLVQTEVRSQQLPDGRFLSVIRDLTDRIEALKRIEMEKDLSNKLIDSLPGVFYWYDENGKFLRWNKQLEIVTGYTPAEIAQMHPTDFFEGEGLLHIKERIKKVFDEGAGDAEAEFISKQGLRTPYYFKAIRIYLEEKPTLLGTGIDISDRKKAEKELMESEEKYRLLFRNSPLPMWVFEIGTYRILDVNEAALHHYGYTKEEFMNLSLLDIRPESEQRRFLDDSAQQQQGLNTLGTWKHKKKDGTLIDVETNAHDIVYNNSPGRLVVSVDITEKLLREQEIRQTSDQLRELADHLNHIREEERTHMAREIHDELGQHLTVLKMDISWLNKKIRPTASELVKTKIDSLLEMLDGTVKTVRRISSDLRPSLLDDLGLVAAIEWQLSEFEKRSGIRTHLNTGADDLPLPNDIKTGLFRIFQESLTNVARHAEANEIAVDMQQEEDKFILRITDDGKGFDKNKIENKRTLGLLGMRERAAMIGGAYDIISTPGMGTTVLVRVPLPPSY